MTKKKSKSPEPIAQHAPKKLARGRHMTNDPKKLPNEMIDRMVATECGLPRVCVFRLCRRNNRCFGPNVQCKHHHRGLLRARFPGVLAKWPE